MDLPLGKGPQARGAFRARPRGTPGRLAPAALLSPPHPLHPSSPFLPPSVAQTQKPMNHGYALSDWSADLAAAGAAVAAAPAPGERGSHTEGECGAGRANPLRRCAACCFWAWRAPPGRTRSNHPPLAANPHRSGA